MKITPTLLFLSFNLALALNLLEPACIDALPTSHTPHHPRSLNPVHKRASTQPSSHSQRQQQQQQQQRQHKQQHKPSHKPLKQHNQKKRSSASSSSSRQPIHVPEPPQTDLPLDPQSDLPSPPPPQSIRPLAATTLRKRDPVVDPSPLLLLPDAHAVWQAGSLQLVKWSRKYAKKLPNDTTVDILLIDPSTNTKLHSLKRYIPFAKGSAWVYVPEKRVDFNRPLGLTLELYHGRGQRPLASKTIATATGTPHLDPQDLDQENQDPNSDDTRPTSALSLMRRSEIHIAAYDQPPELKLYNNQQQQQEERRHQPPLPSASSSSPSSNAHHDSNDDDYFAPGPGEDQPVAFWPEEMRQEYPNTYQPIELDHSFGVHQKVYVMAPYTLAWKIPVRVQELLNYAEQQQQQQHQRQLIEGTTQDTTMMTTFLARLKVELVKDQTQEPVAVLARNIPAETKFQYLQIHDRVPENFYRLRVQMVVVQVKGLLADLDVSTHGRMSNIGSSSGQVIDRYESITRRFWVTPGAL
ncbi:hypothetical protein BGZ94_001272 [Podila epigama]|nr:hypothetical protein BGZ94_001272 [Podila epigama]